jgi:hypothetical protein
MGALIPLEPHSLSILMAGLDRASHSRISLKMAPFRSLRLWLNRVFGVIATYRRMKAFRQPITLSRETSSD